MRTRSTLLGLGVALASLGAGSPSAHAQEPLMTGRPMGDYPAEHIDPNRPLLFGSGALFLGAYGTSAVVGLMNDRKADQRLAVPLLGPWLDLADRQCDQTACNAEGPSVAALIASGLLQGVGVVGVLSSIFATDRTSERPHRIKKRTAPVPALRVAPAPLAGGRGTNYGLALVGTF